MKSGTSTETSTDKLCLYNGNWVNQRKARETRNWYQKRENVKREQSVGKESADVNGGKNTSLVQSAGEGEFGDTRRQGENDALHGETTSQS